jgi:hypothetical protein
VNDEGQWLIPFRGRGESSVYSDNFLWWNGDNIYIMDNHRAAIWCWCQHIQKDGKYNLLHIDKHYDTITTDPTCAWFAHLPDPWITSLEHILASRYESHACPDTHFPVLRYDNYLSLLIAKYPQVLNKCFFATHEVGCEPEVEFTTLKVYDLAVIAGFSDPLSSGRDSCQWICNVDIDYFFCPDRRDDGEHYVRMLSTPYLTRIFTIIKEAIAEGRVCAFTLALSPECCGGWVQAEELAGQVCDIMGIPFRLAAQ